MAAKLPSDTFLALQTSLVRRYEGHHAAQDFAQEAGKLAGKGFEVSSQSMIQKQPQSAFQKGFTAFRSFGTVIVVTYRRVSKSS